MAMASSSSASVAVDKATSDLLITPDWTINIEICDFINSNHWQAKDVVRAVKRRLQHKNPGVQLLALTLLETMVKNCGEIVHFQIVEKNLLGEMVKIVKKKTDLHVRDKILVLLDSWQEAFGGPGGKYPQYYWAYEDLRRFGVEFPPRSIDAAPVFTPPLTHLTLGQALPGFGMPGGSSRRLDETMVTEIEGLSLSSLESMRDVMDLLRDMLQAVGPDDREAVKDEVIVDLVERCRSNQRKLMQLMTTTGEEEVLARGLELNDSLQILLEKHDAIASGSSPMPALPSDLSSNQTDRSSSSTDPKEITLQTPAPSTEPIATVSNVSDGHDDEEEEDDFAQLARRHTKCQPSPTEAGNGASGVLVPIESYQTSSADASLLPATSTTALAIMDPHTPVMNRQEQDIIDLLSITLSTNDTSPQSDTSQAPTSDNSVPQIPGSSSTQDFSSSLEPPSYISYAAPWSQPQPQQQSQQPLIPSPSQSQPHLHQQHPQFRHQSQPQSQPQFRPQQQSQYPPQYMSAYPPPPWAGTPGYANGTGQTYMPDNNNNMFSRPHGNNATSFAPRAAAAPMQSYGSFPSAGRNGTATSSDPLMGSGARTPPQPAAHKPFVPSYRLFEDLNVLGSAEGNLNGTGNTAPSLASSGRSMVDAKK